MKGITNMKIIVIGAVAAGTSAAAKARRNDENAEITIYEKDTFISYSGCGIPYYIGGEVGSIELLTPRDSTFFRNKYNINIKTGYEVIAIDVTNKVLSVVNLENNDIIEDTYDKLIIATGATPVKPNIKGIDNDNVFFLRNIKDALKIKEFISKYNPNTAVIVGSGFIGFEMLENLLQLDMNVTIVEQADKITPTLDVEMATYFENELLNKNINIIKNTSINKIENGTVTLSNDASLNADIVIISIGVRPNTKLAQDCGITLGETKAIRVNTAMQTNIADIYACGDCIETFSLITETSLYRPLGSTANKTGRIAGDASTGGNLRYKGNLSTGIFKFLDVTVATTGLNEEEALNAGYEIKVCHNIKPDKPEYMNGKEMIIKAIASTADGRLLGAQIIGHEGVDKRIDIFATLITYGATVDEIFHLDLAYAPPFSTTKDPVHYTGMILDNAINRGRNLITSLELETITGDVQIVDARSESDYKQKGSIKNAINIPHSKLRNPDLPLDKETLTVTYCNKGVTGNASQNILLSRGFKKVLNLSGGHNFYKSTKKNENR